MKHKKQAQEIKKSIKSPPLEYDEFTLTRRNLLSTGSTLLNLACSGNPYGGFLRGKYYFIVGDSTSGKTFLSLTCFAEAVHNKSFKKHRLIYDNIEDGCLIDVDTLFGEDVADRIESPSQTKDGAPIYSRTIEEFYYHIDDAVKKNKPFIYVLDSMDGLSSEAEESKFNEHKKAHRKGTQSPGSYGDGKAKKNSEGLRKVLSGIRKSGSILLVLSQTRDNLGFGFAKKTRAGGHALRFYATVEFWSSVLDTIKKTVKKKKRSIGVHISVEVKKNRITGLLHKVQMDIYPSYGIDDIGSCVDYLVDEGWWGMAKNTIAADEFKLEGTREKIIKHIEEKGLETELQSIVGKCWKEIEAECALKRKSKYASSD
jgi:RecA/RadA recombinase